MNRARRRAQWLVASAFLAGCASTPHFDLAPLPPTTLAPPPFSVAVRPVTTTATTATSTSAGTTLPDSVQWVQAAGSLVGLSSQCGDIAYLASWPSRNGIIASVAGQGLWWTDGTSNNWTRLGTGKGSAAITNRGTSIVYDPANPNRFWESGIYGTSGGVYRTDDNGATFQQLGDVAHSDRVTVDFTDANRSTLLSGRHETSQLFRSTDGGRTWTDISATLPADIGFVSSPHVVDSSTFLLGTRTGGNSGIFRSPNGGSTWTQVFSGDVTGDVLVTTDGSMYWLLDQGGGIVKSTDKGQTWTLAVNTPGLAPNSATLLELPDRSIAALSSALVVSSDGGNTWAAVGPPLPIDPIGFTYLASRRSFYAWTFDCGPAGPNPAPANSVYRLTVP